MAQIIDGTAAAKALREQVQQEVAAFQRTHRVTPGLATVLVGDNPASASYVRSKHKACGEIGLFSEGIELNAEASQEELLRVVRGLNERRDIHGILVQLPLPPHINADAVIDAVDPEKDVDGLHPINQARLVMGRDGLRPCTPLGVMHLIDSTGVQLKGARAVVAGRSNLVGKPVAFMLLERHATLTICHSRTRELGEEIGRADVVVAAIGRAEMIRGDWIRPGSVVIDVGINRVADGRLVGDVEFATARARAAFITPVPRGVGPMTVAMLMQNTLTAARRLVARGR
ncbi:MAG TPA: bifunctional methylenetetrahydrofolate dehydrogenase/methenyltetrahydrofolate cyclohydrolase FolD [Candidatus Margulisiibacteriota bacterium]|nr:bifunctional methylenetetrahydrofolate dehydrogenase/methenyltetrahydrofolate cyclohydrolase FolD [Candidatus Margulisiibacteriota bacterium]